MGAKSKKKEAEGGIRSLKSNLVSTPSVAEDTDSVASSSTVDDSLQLRKRLKDRLPQSSRPGGDGESLPETPPNESSNEDTKRSSDEEKNNPFSVSFTIDVMAWLLLLCGLFSRLMFLDMPRNIVFDEMHYGKYATMYLRRTFFFDANPPLGKMLIALAGHLVGYDGTDKFGFDKIGTAYPPEVPLVALRAVPAICGAAITPTIYMILCQLGLSAWAGAIAGFLVIFDTALLAQSRYILLDSMMILFALWAILSVLKLRGYGSRPFSCGWWFWLTSAAFNMGCAFSVKYLAFYSCCLCSFLLLRDFWLRLGQKHVSNSQLAKEFCTQVLIITTIPTLIYVGVFYVHLGVLTKAGHHDSLMTSAFQASLEGGLSSIVRGQPLAVAHGSQITLRHTHGRTCWLHSHEHVYPIRYADGRGSSHQQQVSCYGYKDVNNWWIVKRPDREDLAVHEPVDVIKDGDVIQLVHGMTHRALNSHDVAAPMSPHNQEITCYIDYNISMASENLWRVDIVNKDQDEGQQWHSIGSQVRLVHVESQQAMKYSGRVYPEWGFHQNEVVCDKQINQLETTWNVEEHRYTKSDEDKKTIERELFGAELIPEQPTELSFWQKFLELQVKMLVTNQENVQNHNYASDPSEWPFMTRGIAYFIAKESNAQVHLLGNVLIWYTGTLSVVTYCGLLTLYLLRRQRLCYDIPEDAWNQFVTVGEVLLGGYLFHYVPFFFYDRTLFMHHYLPAYLYKMMLTAFVITHIYRVVRLKCANICLKCGSIFLLLLWMSGVMYVFWNLSVLAYGISPLTADQVRALRWKDTWDLIIHKP